MIDPTTIFAFSDELQKLAAGSAPLSSGVKAGLAATGLGGVILGSKGKDVMQDAREGRELRMGREAQQKMRIKAIKKGQY
jgi:hypothetical protein